MYESLSRLIRAKNPEQASGSLASNLTDQVTGNTQWSMAYGYDNNGNLTARVDARNITTNYDYDALNRNKTVTYTNDPASTAAVTRRCDGWGPDANGNPMNYNIPNGKGRAWQVETSGATGSRYTIDIYDVMGRPTKQEQQFYSSGSWSQSYIIQRG